MSVRRGQVGLGQYPVSWVKSSSTEVGLPKRETSTFTFPLSAITSWIVPEKSVNGPCVTSTT